MAKSKLKCWHITFRTFAGYQSYTIYAKTEAEARNKFRKGFGDYTITRITEIP